jgi:NADH-quinone oxidoreductase subunit E
MARLNDANLAVAHEIIGRYPVKKSALIPLLHLAQEQDGWVTDEAMEHIADLVECTPAEVIGTCTFYEMFKRKPVGTYVVNICTNIACQLLGGEELLHHAEHKLGIKAGATTADGLFTIEDVECIAACTEAPCLQVNYRYFHKISHAEFDALVTELRAGSREDIPAHGTLAKVRQHIPAERRAGAVAPTDRAEPVWLARNRQADGGDTSTGGVS